MGLIQTVRNNWKKTVFGLAVGAYGVQYGRESYQISALMKSCSKEAAFYGNQNALQASKVVVILNPAANKKKAEKTFKKYCEPLLHLAGFMVDIVRTDSEGYAKSYMEQLKLLPNVVVIAGGDGTVSEVLTGMMRRNSDRCPIALLPLGLKNDIAKKYMNVSFSSKVTEVKSLINATMNIARGGVVEKGVIKIEQVASEENENRELKPIYAMGYLKWGIGRDINALQEKYWYFGKAKEYCSVLLNAFNQNLTWSCKANVCYSSPCSGCTNCMETQAEQKRTKWSSFLLRNIVSKRQEAVVTNNDCNKQYNDEIDSSNICIYVDEESEKKKLVLQKEDTFKPGYDFLRKYLAKLGANSNLQNKQEIIEFRKMILVPDDDCKGVSKCYSIDNEVYDVRPISLTLIPKAIQLYV